MSMEVKKQKLFLMKIVFVKIQRKEHWCLFVFYYQLLIFYSASHNSFKNWRLYYPLRILLLVYKHNDFATSSQFYRIQITRINSGWIEVVINAFRCVLAKEYLLFPCFVIRFIGYHKEWRVLPQGYYIIKQDLLIADRVIISGKNISIEYNYRSDCWS